MSQRLFLLILASLICVGCSQKKGPPPEKSVPVVAAKVILQDVEQYVESVGTLEANQTVNITAQVEGTVTDIFFTQGSFVHEGDLLFTIDSRTFRANLASALASLAQNEARLAYAEKVATIYTGLAKNDYVSRLSAFEALQNVEVNKANIEADFAAIKNAKINLKYTRIRAPLSGYIGLYSLDIGNFVPKDNTTPLATIKQITPLKVNFSISAINLQRIREAWLLKPLKILTFLQNENDCPLEGELAFINNTVNETTGLILLQGILPNKDERGWPGAFVRIRLYLDTLKMVPVIPLSALQHNEQGEFVFVVDKDMHVELRQINVGFRFCDSVVVKDGLKEDELIVTDGQLNLTPKAKVTISRMLTEEPQK
jgi:membrane fusion protein, multidrug efflux system